MFEKIKQHWTQFKKAPTGARFQHYYESRHHTPRSLLKKMLFIVIGVLVMMVGVFFLAVPGPGLLVILIGAVIVARESLFVSRIFDRIEPRTWRAAVWCRTLWRRLSLTSKILLLAIATALAATAMLGAYKILY